MSSLGPPVLEKDDLTAITPLNTLDIDFEALRLAVPKYIRLFTCKNCYIYFEKMGLTVVMKTK